MYLVFVRQPNLYKYAHNRFTFSVPIPARKTRSRNKDCDDDFGLDGDELDPHEGASMEPEPDIRGALVVAVEEERRAHVRLSLVDATHREAVDADVVAAIRSNEELLNDALRLAAHRDKEPTDEGISLVTTEEEDAFVVWVNATQRRARRVSLDQQDRIKWVMPGIVPEASFHDATIIIGDVPAVLMKRKGRDRPDMPNWCCILLRHLQAKRFAGPLSSAHDCVVCEAVLKRKLRIPTPRHHDRYVCHLCVTVWHQACAVDMCPDITISHRFECPVCSA